MSDTAIAHINLRALSHNMAEIASLMPKQKILPMIKANAYGHGAISIAQTFDSTQFLGVANLSEAMHLRGAGIKNPLVVMRGFCNEEELQFFIQDKALTACIHHQSQLRLLESAVFTLGDQLNVWMKIDTGMHRLGFSPEEVPFVYQKLLELSCVASSFVVLTHLADADNHDSHFTFEQLDTFSKVVSDFPVEKSVLSSAGILAYPHSAYDWIRPGIALYGGSPFPLTSSHYPSSIKFHPVMTLTAIIIAIRRVLPGESVGYGCAFRAKKEIQVAVVGIGYGDGYPRSMRMGSPVLIAGQRCPLIGRVSMDMITVDVSALRDIAVGGVVTLWGEGLSVNEVAACADSIPYELLTQVTKRVKYIYS